MRWGRKGTGIYWEEKASQASVKELIAPGTFPKAELWPGGLLGPRRTEEGYGGQCFLAAGRVAEGILPMRENLGHAD